MAMVSHSFESDSGEQASTTDDVESSSHRWTTDYDEDSEEELEGDHDQQETIHRSDLHHPMGGAAILEGGGETDDSNDEDTTNEENPRYRRGLLAPSCSSSAAGSLPPKRSIKNAAKNQTQQVQSDTETRNLLDDVGEDFDEDFLDLDEADSSANNEHPLNIDSKLFELSTEQQDYYSKCFLYLLEKTQGGNASLNGALNGADSQIVEFFRKSQLDNHTLSRIWALADVNEDGFLNHFEFVVAMHLIILHIKGNIPIPQRLSPSIRPNLTPIRQAIRLPNGCLSTVYFEQQKPGTTTSTSTTTSGSSTTSSSFNSALKDPAKESSIAQRYSNPNYQDFADSSSSQMGAPLKGGDPAAMLLAYNNGCQSGAKQHSLSDDHLHLYAQRENNIGVTTFSDIPPVLVDSHPTALNATTTTSSTFLGSLSNRGSSTSRGPPPKPPPRDYITTTTGGGPSRQGGHGRSASLDLKTFNALSRYPHSAPKSPHLTLLNRYNPNPADLLNPDLAQLIPTSDLATIEATEGLQTSKIPQSPPVSGFFPDLFDYAHYFANNSFQRPSNSMGDDLPRLQQQWRSLCELLGSRETNLAQIRLQLQLQIDEAQKQLNAVQLLIQTEQQLMMTTPTTMKQSIKLTDL